jgi:hypothetical protein
MIIGFDKKFYDLKAIEKTAKAYEKLAGLKVKTNKNKIVVEASNIDKDVESVFKDEFCNYVLSEMKRAKSICL